MEYEAEFRQFCKKKRPKKTPSRIFQVVPSKTNNYYVWYVALYEDGDAVAGVRVAKAHPYGDSIWGAPKTPEQGFQQDMALQNKHRMKPEERAMYHILESYTRNTLGKEEIAPSTLCEALDDIDKVANMGKNARSMFESLIRKRFAYLFVDITET